ncbi:MAG: PBP1A family penicillin-binding protein [Firmicutes bacterium]|nr:PBP1A family penicillin-binding protein [Bacillota bacterium]
MSENDKKRTKRKTKNKKKKKKISIFRVILVVVIFTLFIGAGAAGGLFIATIKNVPEDMNFEKDVSMLNENSFIYDANGKLIEQIQTEEFRTIVSLDEISDHLENAIIAIEDERFWDHHGVDPKGIIRAAITDIKKGALVQGASTITQQLARNIYLNADKEFTRKIKEMYIAIQMERQLTKRQILKSYLNTIYLGQGAYGVQAAAQTYFSKDASELTIAESAMIAGITKHPSKLSLYNRTNPSNVSEDSKDLVGYVEISGKKYAALFNKEAVERQKIILSKMRDLGMITEDEYQNALNEDMRAAIKPGLKKNKHIETSYFNDYVKKRVVEDLIATGDYTEEQAQRALYTGGLKIYSTMDIKMQSKVENVYENFVKSVTSELYGKSDGLSLVKRSIDRYGNILDSYGRIVFYKKSNLLDENYNLKINKGTYALKNNGDLAIKNNKIYYKNLSVGDYYSIDTNKNLITHTTWALDIPKNKYTVDKNNKQFIIKKDFLNKNKDFYTISNNTLLINPKYFYINKTGVVQPQSAMTIMDYTTGQVKALVGGRDIKGSRLLNRATDSPRQPGSSIKPIAVYLPALDNGFTAASIIDDVAHYNKSNELWPKNWYSGYKGLMTLRYAVEQSVNVASVKMLKKIGVNTSTEYLTSLGVINSEDPSKDTFRTEEEARKMGSGTFDEDLAPLALGGMTNGITPLTMTSAYSSIANNGIHTQPIVYTKVEDRDGKIILENKPRKNIVVRPQVSYLMTDILKSAVTNGTGSRAQIYRYNTKIPVAGKTGTTQNKSDAWFVGYTPYYSAGVWIGNDNQAIKLSDGSKLASILWSKVMLQIHEDKGLKPKDFDKPKGFVTRTICMDSGKLATDLCEKDQRGNRTRSEIFIQGTEPTKYCETHVEVAVDSTNGKLVNDYCPDEVREMKVYIKRQPQYIPKDHPEATPPRDYKYSVPTEECEVHTEPEGDDFRDIINDWFFNDNNDTDDINDSDEKNKPNKDSNNKNSNKDNSINGDDKRKQNNKNN